MDASVETGRVSTKISPTFLSSHLLTPHQIDRVTIPAIGTHSIKVEPIGGHTWGENLTNYGGIGKLPFLGKISARDLYVPRSLKHFGSGFSKYEANVEPYQVTSLRKSTCRINDQVIPPTFETNIQPWRYLLNLEDKNAAKQNPYFSHRSIFEVFPRLDPCRRNRTGEPALNKNTRDALCDSNERTYNIPPYSSAFPNYTDLLKEQANRDTHEIQTKHSPESDDQSTQICEVVERKSPCNQCLKILQELNETLVPVTDMLKCAGEEAVTFYRAEDVLHLISRYHGHHILQRMSTQVWEALQILAKCDCDIENEFSNFHTFITSKIFPLIIRLEKSGANLLEGLTGTIPGFSGKIPEFSIRSEGGDKSENVIDARRQCQKLRSFITGTNITSFDRAIIADLYSTDENRKKKRIKGIAPLWPPSRYYVLNNQKMKLQSIGSLPSNFKYQSEIPSREETKGVETGEEEKECGEYLSEDKPVKHVHFSATPQTHSFPTSQYQLPMDPEVNQMKHEVYKSYLQAILPVSCEDPPMRVGPSFEDPFEEVDAAPFGPWECEELSRGEIDPLTSCRYPPAHPPPTQHGGYKMRSIVNPSHNLKSLAQRRYHLLHPAPIPDLRDNHRFRKKYFFSGYHASTFRG